MFHKAKRLTLPVVDRQVIVPTEYLPDDVDIQFTVMGENTIGTPVDDGVLVAYSDNEAETVIVNYDKHEKEDTVTPVVDAIKAIPETVIPEADYSPITEALKNVEDAVFATESDAVDLSPVVDALDKVKEAVESQELPQQKDYSDILNTIAKSIPEGADLSEVVDLLRQIADKPLPELEIPSSLISDGRLKVEVDRIGVGSTGFTTERVESILKTGTAIKAADSPSIDAFGRWRVSEPVTIFDSKQVFDNLPLLYDDQEVSGSGTGSTHNPNHAATEMTVSATTAGRRVRQTFMRFNYQPGKSQLIFCTGTLGSGGTGITAAMGYYDDDNGLFVKSEDGVAYFVKRTSYSGSAVDTAVAQADWNIDTFDGNGASGITLDPTKSQILVIDFEWLGVGRVRMGWVVDGKIYYCHEFLHSNRQAGVYMSTPNLPIRYELENDGTGGAATLQHICASVMSEGGIQNNGYLRHQDTGPVSSLLAGTAYAIMGGRLKSTHLGASVLVENISLIGSANDQCHWELRVGGTVAGTFTFSDVANSAVQVATGSNSNTITGGIEIDGGYFSTTQGVTFTVPNALRLGATIDNTPQEWQLVVIPITNNMTVRASVTWRELL